MFPPEFPVEVSSIEVDNGQTIPTYFLMKKLQEMYGDQKEFHFIMGSDLIPTLKLWHEPEKLVTEVNFVLYNRVGYDIEKLLSSPDMPKNYIYAKDSKSIFGEVSSTEVRRRIAEARTDSSASDFVKHYFNVSGLVTKGVIDYIRENSLY